MSEKLRIQKERLTLLSVLVTGLLLASTHTHLEIVEQHAQELLLGGIFLSAIFPFVARKKEKNAPQE